MNNLQVTIGADRNLFVTPPLANEHLYTACAPDSESLNASLCCVVTLHHFL